MTTDEYRVAPGVNFSTLKFLVPPSKPAHYQAALTAETEPTMDMEMGTLIHAAVLEGKEPAHVVRPSTYPAPATHERVKKGEIKAGDSIPWSGNAGVCKAWMKEQKDAGRVVLTEDADLRQITMTRHLLAHPLFASALQCSVATEEPIFATYRGVECKCLLDLRVMLRTPVRRMCIIDLKKAVSGSPEGFGKIVHNRHYDLQMALYCVLLGLKLGLEEPPLWYWAVVEDSAAAPVTMYNADAWLESGQRKLDAAITLLLECRESGVWPAYGETVQELPRPAWADKSL